MSVASSRICACTFGSGVRHQERSAYAERQGDAEKSERSFAAAAAHRSMNSFVSRMAAFARNKWILARWQMQAGTPFYCYSTRALDENYRGFARRFPAGTLIAYSVKANGNLAVLKTLARLGAGADVVSGGELKKALAAGIPASRIVFSGVGKTRDELELASRRHSSVQCGKRARTRIAERDGQQYGCSRAHRHSGKSRYRCRAPTQKSPPEWRKPNSAFPGSARGKPMRARHHCPA